jgi:energy-coupling factor transport system ATP-binding protein
MVLNAYSLSLSLSSGRDPLFHNISLELDEGDTCLITGRSGSGKTMFGLTLCGFLPFVTQSWNLSGTIELFGNKLEQGTPPQAIGIILDNPYTQISGMKRRVSDELAFPLECRGVETKKIISLIEYYSSQLGITYLLDRSIRTLSGGELQRVIIAGTLISKPRFLFLDRPLTEIDDEFRHPLMTILNSHIKDLRGAFIIAEEPWLLGTVRFQKEFSIDGESAPLNERLTQQVRNNHRLNNSDILTVDSVSYSYDRVHRILRDVSFSLGHGEVVFITGPNGSGKTTLAKIITGILTPSSGTIVIDGVSSSSMNIKERIATVGFSLQNPMLHFCRTTVHEELDLAEKWGNPAQKVIDMLGLTSLLYRHPLELTHAERKRLGIALSCGVKRKILIMDEPSQYQDNGGFMMIVNVISHLADQGIGVLIITHDPRFFRAFPGSRVIHLSREGN